jgi:catechol 2,3-dioxygenase-like lactoylglutathione lyase family enzyme
MRVVGLDHIVLVTPDVERLLTFYTVSLGMASVRLEEWRRGEVAFPSVRVDDATIIDLFQGERSGVNQHHFCLVVDGVDLDELAGSGELELTRGPVAVFGARGLGRSVYVEDPDGNVIELRVYPSGHEAG